MREIKFRAWNKVSDTMTYFDFNTIKDKWDWLYSIHNVYTTSNVTMQYTGLKDKNGVEIYEGDVVSTEDYLSHMANHFAGTELNIKIKKYGIRFERGSFRLYDFKTKSWVAVIDHHTISKVKKIQVIGNIYENPELLEES